jgi:hypothetical protein
MIIRASALIPSRQRREGKHGGKLAMRLLAILIGVLSAALTGFMGIIALSFTGYGQGLAGFAEHWLNISCGIELPLYLILVFVSRRWLAYACSAMSVVIYAGSFLFNLSDQSAPVHLATIVKLFCVPFLDPWMLPSIVVAMTAVYLYRHQTARLVGPNPYQPHQSS